MLFFLYSHYYQIMEYQKTYKNQDTWNHCCYHRKIWYVVLVSVMCPKDAAGMVNSADPNKSFSDLGLHYKLMSTCPKR